MRLVDDAHTACAELRHDAVRAELSTRRQGHGGAEYIAESYPALADAETVPDLPKRPHSTRMNIGLFCREIAFLGVTLYKAIRRAKSPRQSHGGVQTKGDPEGSPVEPSRAPWLDLPPRSIPHPSHGETRAEQERRVGDGAPGLRPHSGAPGS